MVFNWKRSILVVLIAVCITAGGYFWNIIRDSSGPSTTTKPPSEIKRPDLNENTWDVPFETSFDFEKEAEEYSRNHDFKPLKVSGNVQFPPGSSPDNVTLSLNVLPLKNNLSPTSRKQLFNQHTSDNFEPEYFQNKNSLHRFTVRTDKNGKFTVRSAPPGLYVASISDTSWFGQGKTRSLQLPSRSDTIELTARKSITVTGQVVSGSREPLNDASVITQSTGQSTKTNKNGQFTVGQVNRSENPITLTVKKKGYAPVSRLISPGFNEKRLTETIVLKKQASLRVSVLTPKGRSLSTGEVQLKRIPQGDTDQIQMVLTEESSSQQNQSLRSQKSVQFSGLRPGQFQLSFKNPEYQTPSRTVKLEPGKNATITLRAKKRPAMTLSFEAEGSGKPVRIPPPEIQVFGNNGGQLADGFIPQEITNKGVIKGTVHPEMNRAVLLLGNSVDNPKKVTIRRSDLPVVTVPIRTIQEATAKSVSAELNLSFKPSYFDLGTVDWASLYLFHAQSGKPVYSTGGTGENLKTNFIVPEGDYILYGVLKRNDNPNKVVFQQISVAPKRTNNSRLVLKTPAKLKGEIHGTEKQSSRSLQVTVGWPVGLKSATNLPSDLKSSVRPPGQFSFQYIPPGETLVLEISALDEVGSPNVLHQKRISGISAGRTLDAGTIKLD